MSSGAHAPGGAERPVLSVRRGVTVLFTGSKMNVLLLAVPLAVVSECVPLQLSCQSCGTDTPLQRRVG